MAKEKTATRVIIGISKMYQHGKIQVPADVRKLLELKDGDRIYFIQTGTDDVLIEKAPKIIKATYKRTG